MRKIKFKARTWRELAGLYHRLEKSAEEVGFYPANKWPRKYFWAKVLNEWIDYSGQRRKTWCKYVFFIKPDIVVKCKGCGKDFKCGEDEKREYCDRTCETNVRGIIG